jgi:LuxR family maltose regulon positive regulatory protein
MWRGLDWPRNCALALISLGVAELWSLRVDEAETHLKQGVALARRIGRPFLEISGMAHWGVVAGFRSSALAAERGQQRIGLARRQGWSREPFVAIAYPMLAASLIWRGDLEEAERWLAEGERSLQSEVEPATGTLFAHCSSPSTTRERRSRCSHPSSAARSRDPIGCG